MDICPNIDRDGKNKLYGVSINLRALITLFGGVLINEFVLFSVLFPSQVNALIYYKCIPGRVIGFPPTCSNTIR